MPPFDVVLTLRAYLGEDKNSKKHVGTSAWKIYILRGLHSYAPPQQKFGTVLRRVHETGKKSQRMPCRTRPVRPANETSKSYGNQDRQSSLGRLVVGSRSKTGPFNVFKLRIAAHFVAFFMTLSEIPPELKQVPPITSWREGPSLAYVSLPVSAQTQHARPGSCKNRQFPPRAPRHWSGKEEKKNGLRKKLNTRAQRLPQRPINQPVHWSTDQPINQSINNSQSTNRSNRQPSPSTSQAFRRQGQRPRRSRTSSSPPTCGWCGSSGKGGGSSTR